MDVVARTPRQHFCLIVSLGLLSALTPFSIDMYLPSFPAIAAAFQIPATKVALSVSIYFIGFALGQIAYGPFLDRYGRKGPLYFGIGLYIAATFSCIFSRTFDEFLISRFLSALGGSAASVGATAMVRDYFPPEDAPKIFSRLMLVLSVSPLLAPSVGSFVLVAASWRLIFGILAVIGGLNLLIVAYGLPQGAAPDPGVEMRPGPILANFRSIMKTERFAVYSISGALSFTGLFVYVAGSPAIFMNGFHVNAQVYGAIFALLVVGMIGGGQLNLLLVKKFGPADIFRAGMTCQVFFATIFVIGAWQNWLGLSATVAFLFVILLCVGVASPNAAGLALAPFSRNAGSAAALMGFIQLGIGSLVSSLVGLQNVDGIMPTAATIFASSLCGLVILLLPSRTKPGTAIR